MFIYRSKKTNARFPWTAGAVSALMLSLSLTMGGCVSTGSNTSPHLDETKAQAAAVISRINEINAALPSTIRCNVSVSGMMEKRPFKADGKASMSREPQRARIQLRDPIFLAPALEIYADSSLIKFYFPVERVARITRGNFTDLSLSGRGETRFLIAWMFSGEIPLIKNFSVRTVSEEGEALILVIENDSVEQHIVMKKGNPYEITLLNKVSGLHYRVRYGQLYTSGERMFFRNIHAWSRTTGDRVNVYYSDLRFDRQIKASDFSLDIPPDVTLIR